MCHATMCNNISMGKIWPWLGKNGIPKVQQSLLWQRKIRKQTEWNDKTGNDTSLYILSKDLHRLKIWNYICF